ncbi:MAG: 50S ribosomal protein L10 [Thermodesulfobacteriota bacterium]|nr:50S ribosomal protein L10 [Thermodesulfobacteriota bacterium]
MNLSTKKELVEKLRSRLVESEISILVDYKGLDVEAMTQLRSELRKEGVELEVVKNTLLSIAAEGTDCALIKDSFLGPNAIVTSGDDPVAPARVLAGFAKENKKLEIKIGSMNGKVLAADEIMELAKMPSKEVLLSQLLSVMNGVPTGMVRVLSEVPRSFLTVVKAIGDQKEAA